MPNLHLFTLFSAIAFVVAVGTMAAATFAAVPPFEVVLFGKHFIPLFREVKVSFFEWNSFVHSQAFDPILGSRAKIRWLFLIKCW